MIVKKYYFNIALRNIWSHKRRNILVITAIVAGVCITLFLEGILEDTKRGWLNAIIHSQTGHIQIMKRGYLEKELTSPLDTLILSFQKNKIKEFLEKQPEVDAFTERLYFSGMIATREKTSIFQGVGVDPVNEYRVFSLLQKVEEGKIITPLNPDGCVIGINLAKSLNLNIGDTATLITHTQEGIINAVDVEIVGIFKSGQKEVDSMCLYVSLEKAQELLDTQGKVSHIIILCKKIKQIPYLLPKLKDFIKISSKKNPLEVYTWEDLSPLYKRVIAMNNFQTKLIEAIIFFLIILWICNTVLLSVFERIREIGTMTAFGFRRKEILSLFLYESTLIGVIGGIVGIILGSIIVCVVYFIGIPFVPPGTERVVYMRPLLCVDKMIFSFILALLSTTVGGLYPSFWASKIKPVEALKFT